MKELLLRPKAKTEASSPQLESRRGTSRWTARLRVAFFRVDDRPSSDRSMMHLTAIQLDRIATMSPSYRTRSSPMATSRVALSGR